MPLDQLPFPQLQPLGRLPKFYYPLYLEYGDGKVWSLTTAFTFASVVLERVIEIPAGFKTDFASIPQVLWNIYPPTGPYGKAAVVHDFLYRTAPSSIRYAWTRKQADDVLEEAMEELQVARFTRWVIYRGVRIGGSRAFRSDKLLVM